MIDVIASITVKEGKIKEFLAIFNANVPKVLAEDGCISYRPVVDVLTGMSVQETNANIVTIIEQWESIEALEAHLAAPHMMTYKEDVQDLISGLGIKILQSAV